jgi:hypothetical protein
MTSAVLHAFRWHGCEIQSSLPLAFPVSSSDGTPLRKLRISSDGDLQSPTGTMLAQSAFTGYRLYREQDGCWLVRDEDRIHLSRDEIRISPAPTESEQLEYLRMRALALWLHLVEMPPLHASAVARNGHALALVGDSGAGKSTLAAALTRAGYCLYADDLLPLALHAGQVAVHPGGLHLRLWPDSAQQFHAEALALPRVGPDTTKRQLNFESVSPADAPRLRAIFLLQRGGPDSAIRIEKLPGSKALLALLANGQMAGPAELLGLGASRMQIFAEVLRSVCVYELHYPSDFALLPEVCAALDRVVQA